MYAILDIETTGGKYNEEGITEIAIHKFDGHQVVDTFISLINPEKEIQPFVVNLTGIHPHMVKTAPKFHEVAKRIVEITEDTVLVAHNAQFDYRILRTEFKRLGYNFERRTLCTVDLSKILLPDAESYSLGKLARHLGIAMSDRHRANGDALATLKLFKLLLAKDTDKQILKEKVRSGEHGELSDRQLDIVEAVPAETGVYYMQDRSGDILFIGSSNHLKKQVNGHFTHDGSRMRQLQKETKKVSFERTGNILIALLKEHEELRKLRPRYNARPKRWLFKYGLFLDTDAQGYHSLQIASSREKGTRVTTFSSIQSARTWLQHINEEFGLCPKRNGLDGTPDAPCEKLAPEAYNARVAQALDKYSLMGKDVVILDKGRETGERSVIWIQKGRLRGYGFCDLNHQINNIAILEQIVTPIEGEANKHFIIDNYLRKKKGVKILPLNG